MYINFNYQRAMSSFERCEVALRSTSLSPLEAKLLNDKLLMLQAQIQQQTIQQEHHEWPINFAQ